MTEVVESSETSESEDSRSSSPFRKETEAEILAELPADYRTVFGELVFLEKNCSQNKNINILTTDSEGSSEMKDTTNENTNSHQEEKRNSSGNDEQEESSDSSDSSDDEPVNIRAEYAKKLAAMNKEHFLKEGALMASTTRLPYTKRERLIIIYYLIAKNKIMCAKGRDIWIQFMADGYLPHRTPKSIWNHVMQSIIPQIETFKLPKEIESIFVMLRSKNTRKRA